MDSMQGERLFGFWHVKGECRAVVGVLVIVTGFQESFLTYPFKGIILKGISVNETHTKKI